MSDGSFQCPKVTDQDILWATRLLDLQENAFTGPDGKDPRRAVLKSMMPMDVAACPGSGKTTLLVAKLAILANKWTHRTRGICVLSHTNAARHEIEARLGNTAPGRRLLAYPHFVGTIQRFVDEFIALPCLRSHGYPVKMVDTDTSLQRRWNALQYGIRCGLETNRHDRRALLIMSSGFDLKQLRWGRGNLGASTATYTEMQDVCRRSVSKGYHCYEEMFVWAQDLLDKVPGVAQALRGRFPLLFIDEAQDNSEAQAAILHRIFMSGDEAVVRQRFGDPNQAIYDFFGGTGATTDAFPSEEVAKEDLPNSHRFGQTIADLADPLGLRPYGLKGHGPSKPLASGSSDARHTIFLFDDVGSGKVLYAYAELLMDTFSGQELREGTFTAIGQVHNPEKDDHKPRHVGHYGPEYAPGLTRADPASETLLGYIVVGQAKAVATGEAHLAVDKIAEGILRLAGMGDGGGGPQRRVHHHRHVVRLLEQNPDVRRKYEDLTARFAAERDIVAEGAWNSHWAGIAREVAETISGGPLNSAEADAFLHWQESGIEAARSDSAKKSQDNLYRHSKNGKTVAIRVGSIHSAKGQTHTATLVLETFWHAHNLDKLLDWLVGNKSGGGSLNSAQESRLKVHYVAMTRPTHLLCLALKKSTIGTKNDLVQKLTARGWNIQDLASP